MENFELLRNVTIGQYIPTDSVVHRLDPRAKLLSAIFLTLAISFNVSIIANLLFLLLMFGLALLSRVPLSYIMRGFLLGLPVLAFVILMQFLFLGRVEPPGAIYFEWGWFRVTRYSLHLIIISLLRIVSLIFLTSLMTMTSTTTELTHGVESLLKPFRRLGVPSHELALILMITLRFVPTLAEEMERIMKAQASRGADIGGRRMWRPDKIARSILPLLVPLFISAFRRAEDLILAMEARGYVSGEGRTKFIELESRMIDFAVVAVTILFMLIMMFYQWPAVKEILAGYGVMGL
jgi:energy-coupling factor transport system permease protein